MAHPTTRTRSRAVKWYLDHGRNASATAREFGVSRSTIHRWLGRYDPVQPGKSLRRRPPRRERPAPKQALFLSRMFELHTAHPHWGPRRLQSALVDLREDAPSESTVGRWLQEILRRCPLCGGSDGLHSGAVHAVFSDFVRLRSIPPLRRVRRTRRPRPSPRKAAVAEATAIVEGAARRCPDCGERLRFSPRKSLVICPDCGFRRGRELA